MIAIDMTEGKIELWDQLRDYQFWGDAHSEYNLLDFIINTYEDKILPPLDSEKDVLHKVGRPWNQQVPYSAEARKETQCCVKCSKGHETLPHIVGQWFAWDNDAQEASFMQLAFWCF